VAINGHGETTSLGPSRRLRVDPKLPRVSEEELSEYGEGPDGLLLEDRLAGRPQPSVGRLASAAGSRPAEGPRGRPDGAVATDGEQGKAIYRLRRFPEWDYSVALRVRIESIPGRLGQVFGAGAGPGDDPLRLVVDGGRLSARIEAGGGAFVTSPGVPVEAGRWAHLAAVKRGGRLQLYVDGKPVASAAVPACVSSRSTEVALGGNPRSPGDEHLAARFADLRLYARALSPGEVEDLSRDSDGVREGGDKTGGR
jgi:sialidase-1